MASGVIYGPHSAFWCVRCVKRRCTIFYDQVGRRGFHKKHIGTCYSELVVLHPVGSVGHEVNSGPSGTQNIDALSFMLRWDRYGFDKNRGGTRYAELVFMHSVGFVEQLVHCVASRASNIDALFFILRWAQCGFHKNCMETC
jgi:hypothetical protein